MRRNLLFVSYRDGEFGHDLTYALDLAKMTDKGMSILLLDRKELAGKFEDGMTTVTSAGTGQQAGDRLRNMLEQKCRDSGLSASVHHARNDADSSVRRFLKQDSSIDMVILSPSITENGEMSTKELKRLLRIGSRPIVTMSRQTVATA